MQGPSEDGTPKHLDCAFIVRLLEPNWLSCLSVVRIFETNCGLI
jgi:hypothetical protein